MHIRRRDAKLQGLKRYFTGKPCRRGHVAERFVEGGCVICSVEDQRASHGEKQRAKNRAYFQRPEVKLRNKLRQRLLYAQRPALFRAITARCRAARLLRVPSWSETELIKEFYQNCPPGMEVDHDIPLLGRTVSGLHVIANLRYLTMPANRAKGNRF